MAAGFSFKIAPGVRIRTSRYGMRASIGPRAARVHVGGGYRPTVSTGAGPVTLYSAIGRTPARRQRSVPRSTGHRSTTTAHTPRTATQAELNRTRKAYEAQQIATALQHLLALPRGSWPPARPPVAPPSPPPDEAAITARHEREATAGIGWFHHRDRQQALAAADVAAAREIEAARVQATAARDRAQQQLDHQWSALCANEVDVVLATLAEAFADNEVPAAATAVTGDRVYAAVLVGGLEVIPDRLPSRTEAGNLSLRAMAKGTRNDFYAQYVCGHVLAVVRETFAVAPGIGDVHVVAVRQRPPDAYGKVHHEAVLAGAFARPALTGVAWDTTDAATIFDQVATECVVRRAGQARELSPLDLTGHDDLAAMLASIDHEG
jgi:hypothetical protein